MHPSPFSPACLRGLSLAAMAERWWAELPAEYAGLAVVPMGFEQHRDRDARADKVVGLDAEGRRCYLRHSHLRTEDRFDVDEFPLEVPVLHERRIVWRLRDGRWLSLAERTDRLESCRPRRERQGPTLLARLPAEL